MSFSTGWTMPTEGLSLLLDAANVKSYPGSGTSWYDLSGNGNTGTLTNGPTYNSGGYISFDGTNDLVSVADSAELRVSTDGISYGCWMRKDSGTGYDYYMKKTSEYMLRTPADAEAGDVEGFVYVDTDGSGSVNAEPRVQTGTELADDTWVFPIVTWDDDGSYILYIDGVAAHSNTKTGAVITTTNALEIGGNSSGYPDCDIAMAFVYQRALSSDEVEDIYEGTRGRFT